MPAGPAGAALQVLGLHAAGPSEALAWWTQVVEEEGCRLAPLAPRFRLAPLASVPSEDDVMRSLPTLLAGARPNVKPVNSSHGAAQCWALGPSHSQELPSGMCKAGSRVRDGTRRAWILRKGGFWNIWDG